MEKNPEDLPKEDVVTPTAVEKNQALQYEEKKDYGMREIVLPDFFGGRDLRFNPVTSILAIVLLWGITIWCMVSPEEAKSAFISSRTNIADLFTWFYVVTNPAFMVFVVWIAYRYGDIRLGPQDSKPEFSDITYFSMLFSAGIGVGLFFYGVAEPLWHRSSHWFSESGYRSDDDKDMFAMNLTVFHWGITGWSQYLIIAICSGLASFRFKLPWTIRSCFYPLLGEYTWGWLGDVVDGYTIVTTVAGVCTSLGLGAFNIAAGLKRVGAISEDISEDDEKNVLVISIWIITFVATISTVSGLSLGIKYLSQIGFGLGMLLLFLVFCMEKTNYILNLVVQEIGYYLQWSIWQLNFHTDAFGQLAPGEGRASDGNSAATWWMDAWTIFYIGWWVAWAAFVGLFIGRISKGRTIRSIIVFTYIIPLFYTILWFGVFGGVGLRQARQATELQDLGLAMHNDSNYFQSSGSSFCYDVPQIETITYMKGESEKTFTNSLMGVTPVCLFNSGDDQQSWFNVLNSFSYPEDLNIGFGPFLSWISIFSVGIYFITSSDSGSLIVDHLAANGFEDNHWIQRVFWAVTEGATATALLVSGGSDALRALQAASILSGLPFTFFLIFMCLTITRMCQVAEINDKEGTSITLQEDYSSRRTFAMPVFGGIFNIFEVILSLGRIPEKRSFLIAPSPAQYTGFFVSLIAPFIPLNRVYSMVTHQSSNKVMIALYTIMYYTWIVLFALTPISIGFKGFAWSALCICGCILTNLRHKIREDLQIQGNMASDFIVCTILWPQVLVQLQEELEGKILDNDSDDLKV